MTIDVNLTLRNKGDGTSSTLIKNAELTWDELDQNFLNIKSAPTATVSFNILRNGNSIGSITFSANSIVGVYSATAAVTINVGDIIHVKGPDIANASLTNIMVSLYGILN
jgi:hypothetical protein